MSHPVVRESQMSDSENLSKDDTAITTLSETTIMATASTTIKTSITTSPTIQPSEHTPTVEMSKMSIEESNEPKITFQEQFRSFAKFGDTKSDGKQITLSQSDKWMKQAKVIDKKITTTDTGIHFKKFKSLKISYADYNKYLDDLAKTKKIDLNDIKTKMRTCGSPGVNQPTTPSKAASTIERLTDTSKYTGTHKERFDSSGKGKGLAGRKNVVDSSGYVTGYQNKNTYDNSTH